METTTKAPDLLAKIEQFRERFEADARVRSAREYPALSAPRVAVHFGPKYARVDIHQGPSASGRYMVELSTGRIYGIKGYGVIHQGHQYGDLNTIDNWDWSGYHAVPKEV